MRRARTTPTFAISGKNPSNVCIFVCIHPRNLRVSVPFAFCQITPLLAQVIMQTSLFKTFLARLLVPLGAAGESVGKIKAELEERKRAMSGAGEYITGA